jgi:Tol biopolymer transport system component
MNDRNDFEARLAAAFADYADRAPVEVDAVSLTAAMANRTPHRRWSFASSRASWLVVGAALALLAIGAALVVGAYLLRPRTAIGGGGPMIINQVDLPIGGDWTRPTYEHVFALDAATGDRTPIVELPVTTKSYGWMSATWSPDRTHALLFDGGDGVRGIVDVASHRLTSLQLRTGETLRFEDRLAWARTGDRIASIVSSDANPTGSILISDLTGREISRLALPPGWIAGRPTWSPDGSSLMLSGCLLPCADGANESQLLLIPIDGSPMRVLLEPAASYGPAVWSPDGSTIAVESPTGITTMDLLTGRERTVTRGHDHNPAWSPDGHRIAFARMDDQGTNGAIYVVDVDGTNLRQLTNGTDDNPDWSPDGTTLVFGRQNGVNPDVWVVGADGGEPRRLLVNASADW